jgi:hypothetical protein
MKTPVNHPPKQRVRDYFILRTKPEQLEPPPSPADIQRELGWDLLKNNDEVERE